MEFFLVSKTVRVCAMMFGEKYVCTAGGVCDVITTSSRCVS